jgi:glyoxylase-like metal-dependent hydrolase (beta-lactamase superfamily II)
MQSTVRPRAVAGPRRAAGRRRSIVSSVPESIRRRELGRGERVLPGVWRLRLPLPFPAVPHCNAWALRAGDGIVLVDCGMHEEGSPEQLERAMGQVGLRLEDVRLLVCTHAHADHYGQAAEVIDASGCELWMHPDHAHTTSAAGSPDEAMARRIEIARTSGVPVAPLAEWVEAAHRPGFGITRIVEPDRDLVPGVVIDTDVGRWTVHETPGHAPSHVCLHQAERRILISGDHLLGRVSPYFDYGWSPDPVGEFLSSLDVVERLDARLCLAGHGRTFTDVRAHIEANRALMRERLQRTRQIVAERGPVTAHDVVPLLYGAPITSQNASWWMQETLCYLRHLEVTGALRRGGDPERWSAA